MNEKITKSESDGQHPCGNYLICEDPEKSSTWHLRVKDKDGKPDHTLMGAAWAALHGGYRGNKYEGPGKDEAIKKLKGMYESEKMDLPSGGNDAARPLQSAHGQMTGKPSITALKRHVTKAIQEDPRFDTDKHGYPEGSPGDVEPECVDILVPDDDGGMDAIIKTDDGRLVKHGFSWDGQDAEMDEGDSEPTEATPVYSSAAKPATGLQSAQPRRDDGTYHSADKASAEAEAATTSAKTKDEHTKAMQLHQRAQKLQADAGNQAKAEDHRVKAKAHEDCANSMDASRTAGPAVPTRNAMEASFDVPAPTKFDAFMVMPAGVHQVTLTRLGRPHTVTVNVNAAGARARQEQLDAVNAACKLKAYNCFDHERKKASSHPQRYWWEDGSKAGRPAGIYESAEPTRSGLDAVGGKDYQGWSETFFVDNEFAGPDKPAQIINPLDSDDGGDPNDYRVMGTLTNNPAFTNNEPLFAATPQKNSPPNTAAARTAGAHSSSINQNKNMNDKQPLDAAALQARITQLEQDISALEAKDDAVSKAELRASRSELEARQADLKLAKQTEKITALEAAETKRKELEATKAVQMGIDAMAIPALDKKQQDEWKQKFTADPSLIPLMAGVWDGRKPTRQTPNASRAGLEAYGGFKEGPNRILRALSATMEKQRPIRGLDASANAQRTAIGREAAIIWANEIRTFELDAEGKKRPTIKPEFLLAPFDAALDAAADTDTLGTLAGTFVTQRYLDIFMYKLPLIANGKIMTDFSDQPSDLNQAVSTRKVVVPATVSFDPTLDTDGYPKGWVVANPPQTADVNITMDELIGVPIQFDLAALSSTQRQLFMEQAPAAAYANALYLLKKIYAVCTAANFAAYANVTAADANGIVKVPTAYATYAVALIDFARSKIAEVAAAFDANEVPDEDRSLLLNAAYYNKATTDPSLVTFFAGQQSPEIVTQGNLPDLAGFTPIKAPNFPGTNNRFGMFLQKNGLLVKTRLPANLNMVNPGAGNGSVTQIVHPETGVAMMLVQWVDHKRGYSAWNPCFIIGAAKGDTRGGLVGTTQ
ncbi:MAG: hypothetical protein KGL39_13305 [Patescibacteria group bacterium]|nr:hypothetical protein [Patescibacteria group bacterium]